MPLVPHRQYLSRSSVSRESFFFFFFSHVHHPVSFISLTHRHYGGKLSTPFGWSFLGRLCERGQGIISSICHSPFAIRHRLRLFFCFLAFAPTVICGYPWDGAVDGG